MSTMPPNIITSSPSGGRFDFDDGGTYCGGWQDGKAHGHGVCTGPKNVGEYSGSWNFGFEMSGVYKWTNGAVYEGRWQNGKRHGVGVEYNGKWIYKGEWSQGLKGRYGVKASSNSAVKYEGTWANGLQDGYGSETYSDGGYYQGQMCRGLRHGYGVRKSAPYGDSQLNNPSKNGPLTGNPSSMLLHANSVQSTSSASDLQAAVRATNPLSGQTDDDDSPKPEDGFKPNIDRTLVSKNGFVLVSKPLDVPMPSLSNSKSQAGGYPSSRSRRNSLTNKLAQTARLPNQTTASLLRGLRLRKQKSTSDLDVISGKNAKANQQPQQQHSADDSPPIIPFTLSPEELDITDPTTVETYMGEWKHDKRNGHGVCERSDGLKYEGQWHNDMKCGYGITTFKDGTKEEGKYKNNILIVDSKVKRFFQLGGSNIRQRIDESVKMANQALTMALKKAEIADNRAATARDKADQAMTAAIEADRDSQIAYSVARQYSDTSLMHQQQQMMMFGQQPLMQQFPASDQYAMPQNHFMPTNLNMGLSPLQMRRISQNQQRSQAMGEQQDSGGAIGAQVGAVQQLQLGRGHQEMALQGQQQLSNAHQYDENSMQQQMAGATLVEPFNGRRGSFRGASQPPTGTPGNSTGYSRQASFRQQQQAPQRQRNQHLHHHQTADPFSDLFDHYKGVGSSNITPGYRSGPGDRRGLLSKQTSLDHAQLRGASVPRHLAGGAGSSTAAQQRHRFRASSSVDQADQDIGGSYEQESMQQQLRHLVTSGEQLQQQQQQVNSENQQQHFSGPTPTSSSHILAQSSAAGSLSTTFNASPSDNSNMPQRSVQQSPSPNADQYHNQLGQQYSNQQYQNESMYYHQRDVHSLADEQLYLADYRRKRARQEPLGRTEYENYDFTITSTPRPTQLCRRRTASLTRTSSMRQPPSVATSLAAGANILQQMSARRTPSNSLLALAPNDHSSARRQQAPASSNGQMGAFANSFNGAGALPSFNVSTATTFVGEQQVADSSLALTSLANNHHPGASLSPTGADANSLSSSVSAVSRKTSLQVRYDPIELGGLMSREEVAALSHAQREQKRIEADLAEKRAKQPLLHLYMTFKEFVRCNRLIITVIIVNICLMRMFANLIT